MAYKYVFTAFCRQVGGGGTTWVEAVESETPELSEVMDIARKACADAWECDPEDIHVLGIAEGDVSILLWADIED